MPEITPRPSPEIEAIVTRIMRASETGDITSLRRIRTDTDVMGLAVNKAARVTSAAAGGQIVVSSVVRELVGADPSFRFGDSFLAELKGIDGIHEIVPVDWRSQRVDGRRP